MGSRGGFPNLPSWAQLWGEGLPLCLEEASSIPGLYPLMLTVTLSPQLRQPKLFPDIAKCPWGAKSPLVEN